MFSPKPALQPVLLVSHVDELDPRIQSDKSFIFSSGIVRTYLDLAHDLTGVSKDCIFPVRSSSSSSSSSSVIIIR